MKLFLISFSLFLDFTLAEGQVRQSLGTRAGVTPERSLNCAQLKEQYSCRDGRTYPVHLTFDDGPSRLYTEKVLEILKRHQVKATFFVVGENVKKYPDLLRRTKREGHLIGSHSFSHKRHTEIPRSEARALVSNSVEAITEVTGEPPKYFRLPYGDGWDKSGRSLTFRRSTWRSLGPILKSENLEHIGWHIDSYDSDTAKAQGQRDWSHQLLKSICDQQGGVILMHDTSPVNAETLDYRIRAMKCLGHNFANLESFAGDPFLALREDTKAILPKHFKWSHSPARSHQHTRRCTHNKSSGWWDTLSGFMRD